MKEEVLSVLVSNHFGVLTRVTNLFGRRGFNIKALSVGETENPAFSRITIITEGDEQTLNQIQKQLSKLEDVKKAVIIPDDLLISRELLLIKVSADAENRPQLDALISEYSAKIASQQSDCLTLELTAAPEVLNLFIEKMRSYGIMEMCRTGSAALALGTQTVYHDAK